MAFKVHSAAALLLVALTVSCRADNDEEETPEESISVEILSPPSEVCERTTKRNDVLSVLYVGTLTESGKQFDASIDRDIPFQFQLGAGQVIKGWEEGLTDMCVGEKRKLVIPASKGYGQIRSGDSVPPNAGLTFEVELLEIERGPDNIFHQMDSDGDNFLSRKEVSDYLNETLGEGEHRGEEIDQFDDTVKHIFEEEDNNNDGFISYVEFGGQTHDAL